MGMTVAPPKIVVGYRVGRITVIGTTEQRKNGYMVWRCKCGCGNEMLLDTRALQRGTKKDCGCETKLPPGVRDLKNARFGQLTVLEATQERGRGGSVVWKCRCDCGNVVYAPRSQLTSGYKKSCGCLSHPPLRTLQGRRFGQLTVIEYVEKRSGQHIWRCRCDCGRETEVRENYLMRGHTASCGCLQGQVLRESLKLVEGTSILRLEVSKKGVMRSNTSGYNGVYFSNRTNKWCAQITFQGKTHYLGSFEKKEDAIRARQRGEEMYDDFLERYYRENPEAQKEFKPGGLGKGKRRPKEGC